MYLKTEAVTSTDRRSINFSNKKAHSDQSSPKVVVKFSIVHISLAVEVWCSGSALDSSSIEL